MKISVVSLLFALFLLNVLVARSQTLKFFVEVARHGDRAPVFTFPLENNATLNAERWPLGIMELTAKGMIQHYELGVALRDELVNSGFLNSDYNAKEILYRSTHVDRTIQSAQSQLLGLYPLGTGPADNNPGTNPATLPQQFQPVPIYMESKATDPLLSYTTCPRYQYDRVHTAYVQSSWLQSVNEAQPLIDYVNSVTGGNFDFFGLQDVWDIMSCEQAHGYSWLPGLNQSIFDQVVNINGYINGVQYSTSLSGLLTGGPILYEILQAIEGGISGGTGQKMLAFIGHDTTIMSVLAAIQAIPANIQPGFASTIMMRVYANAGFENSTNLSDHYMTVQYGTLGDYQTLKLPFCATVNCTMTEFLQGTQKYVLSIPDWTNLCAMNSTAPPVEDVEVDWRLTVALAVCLPLLAILIVFIVLRECKYRKYSRATIFDQKPLYAQV